MLSNNATPANVILPVNVERVKRRLVVRNALKQEVLLKLVPYPRTPAIHLASEEHCLAPRTGQHVHMEIETKNLKSGQQIRGYIRISPEKKEDGELWLKTEGGESRRQLAFSLNVRSSDSEFSAYDTIVDLPGSAIVWTPTNVGRLGIEDDGMEEAISIEDGTLTAQPFGSMETVVAEMQIKKDERWFNWESNEDCWLLNKLVGTNDGKKLKSFEGKNNRKGRRVSSLTRSQYIDPKLQALGA